MKKYKLKKWVRVVITLVIIVLGILIYRYLYFNGALAGKTSKDSIIILLGWFWLVIGQITVLYAIWES